MARARAGWVLAEILCSAVMVSLLAGQIIESAGMMVRASASGLEARVRTLDFSSIAGEADCASSSGRVLRGTWQADADVCADENGMSRVEISVSLRSNEAQNTIHWTVWDISGRAR